MEKSNFAMCKIYYDLNPLGEMACFGNFFFFLAPSPDVLPASGQLTDPRTLHTHTHTTS